MVRPSEYLPEIWGGEMADDEAWDSREQLQEFMDLVMQHWNAISRTLQTGDVYLPILSETRKMSRTGTTGRRASCGACRCATMIGRN
jgi:yecA family protein